MDFSNVKPSAIPNLLPHHCMLGVAGEAKEEAERRIARLAEHLDLTLTGRAWYIETTNTYFAEAKEQEAA